MEQLGPYLLTRQIAVGGMAEVYLAKTGGVAGFERYVALKRILPGFAGNQDFIEMLIDEAKIAAQLSHPNIVQTLDLGCQGDVWYLVMEYVEGVDVYNLSRIAASVGLQLPFDACAFIARELAAGLDYAHGKRDRDGRLLGIIHRDVAPDNILVSYTGAVKLVDFGIARATSKAKKTAHGTIKGKWSYMSPEQVSGGTLDATTDIYSAGIVLYEMLTGRCPYEETNIYELAQRIREGVFLPPSSFRGDVPPALERIVLRALSRERSDRYQSAGEMANELQAFLQSYSPAFVTSTLGALVGVLLDRARIPIAPLEVDDVQIVEIKRADTAPIGSPAGRVRARASAHIVPRRIDGIPRIELDDSPDDFTIEDNSKQMRIGVDD